MDLSKTKILKLAKNPEEGVLMKEKLKKNYKILKDLYKYYSSINPSSNAFAISSNAMNEFLNEIDFFKFTGLSMSDIGIDLIFNNSTNENESNKGSNVFKSIIRHEFLELLVRLSIRYAKKSNIDNDDALNKLIDECIKPNIPDRDCHKWRTIHFWTEENDNLIQKYIKPIKLLFKYYSGKHTLPTMRRHLSLEEFAKLFNDTGLIGTDIPVREIYLSFNSSMKTQIDEVQNDQHLKMYKNEFIEALSRIAFKKIVQSPYESKHQDNDKYRSAPLHFKLKNLIEFLMVNVFKKEELKMFEESLKLFG